VTAAQRGPRLEQLAAERPESRGWLGLVGRAAREAHEPAWAAVVPPLAAAPPPGRPALAGAVLRVDRAAARRWLDELLDAAIEGAGIEVGSRAGLDPVAVLQAAVDQSRTGIEAAAAAGRIAPHALRAIAELAAFPLLQACGRRLGPSIPPGWWEGYCPVCGAWPALAEDRGVERARRLRCGRCGGDWEIDQLRCPFCASREHARLGALVPAQGGGRRRIETCGACSGYLKVLTRLDATPRAEVLLEDLASVDLDLAALAEGFVRPDGPGCPLGVMVVERPGLARRLLGRTR
jgi:FdhE protein